MSSSDERARERESQRRRHAERIASKTCTRCGKLPPEPGLKMCRGCGERRRAADRDRRAGARQQGLLYAGRDPDQCRRADRAGDRRRRRAWLDAGLCTSCGRRPPVAGRSVCAPCRNVRRAIDRARYAARRAAGLCVRCARPTFGGASRCGRCSVLERERTSHERKKAVDRKRYARRRAQKACVDCSAPTAGTARCPSCACRSNTRAPERHLMTLWPPQITVIELETDAEIGIFETEAEAAASLVFAKLRPDQVEIRSNVPLMAIAAAPP